MHFLDGMISLRDALVLELKYCRLEMIPTAIPAPAALAQHKLKAQERNNAVKTTTTAASSSLQPNGRKPVGSRAASSNGKNKTSAGPSAAASTEGTPDVVDEPNEMDLS